MQVLFLILFLSAFGITLGIQHRASAVIFFMGFSNLLLMDAVYYKNHLYLIACLSFLMIFINADSALSISRQKKGTVPFWQIVVLRLQFGCVYVFAGLAKINADWFAGEPVRSLFKDKEFFSALPSIQEMMVFVFSFGGLVFDLLIFFLLLNKRSRKTAIFVCILFHLTNHFVFGGIRVFPFLMLASLFLFLDHGENEISNLQETASTQSSNLILAGIIMYCALQIFLPLRHHLYQGDVLWTSQGDRFAWRMILRKGAGRLHYRVVDSQSGKEFIIHPKQYLTPRQLRPMVLRPGMILEFAHFLKRQAAASRVNDPKVYAESFVTINNHHWQPYINSQIDLAKIRKNESYMTWVIPRKNY